MCCLATEIYTEAREVAEHLSLLAHKLRRLQQQSQFRNHLPAAQRLLQERGDTLAADVLAALVEQLAPDTPLRETVPAVIEHAYPTALSIG